MLIDRRNFWKLHGVWLIVVCAGSAAASAWCIFVAKMADRWPGGGSLPGLTLGALAAVIFLFEFALVVKKTRLFRTARWTLSAQTWMKAHIWLGLFTVPLVLLHSGGRLGGPLTTLLLATFAVVILSGLWGLALQNLLPRMLLEGAPAETVYSQIDAVGRQYASEARRLVFLHCGASENDLIDAPADSTTHQPSLTTHSPSHIRGAPRPVGPEIKRSPHPERERPQVIPAPAVRAALRDSIEPYLASGLSERGLLSSRQRNQWFFDDLRLRVTPELRSLVAQLEDLCERRRQLNLQRWLHFWLHNWLWLHLPLSVLLLICLAAHILMALRYD
jgi:hypothetical protein